MKDRQRQAEQASESLSSSACGGSIAAIYASWNGFGECDKVTQGLPSSRERPMTYSGVFWNFEKSFTPTQLDAFRAHS